MLGLLAGLGLRLGWFSDRVGVRVVVRVNIVVRLYVRVKVGVEVRA